MNASADARRGTRKVGQAVIHSLRAIHAISALIAVLTLCASPAAAQMTIEKPSDTTPAPSKFRSADDVTGGFGVRYEIARTYGIHMGIDLAFAPDNTAVYIQVGSAWARP